MLIFSVAYPNLPTFSLVSVYSKTENASKMVIFGIFGFSASAEAYWYTPSTKQIQNISKGAVFHAFLCAFFT